MLWTMVGMRRARRASHILGLVAVAGAAYACWHIATGNFHTVVPHEVYRSAQPSPERLARYTQHYGIRSVINLRGKNTSARWYRDQISAARDLGIVQVDFRMSASRRLSVDEADALVKLMKAMPKPILIHCSAGADRSGLAAALYLAAIAGAGESRAERQLSIKYGHFGIPYFSRAYAMDESWEDLEPWLGFGHS